MLRIGPITVGRAAWPVEYEQLATYNAERLRGIKHHKEWVEYMAGVQKRYNEEHGAEGMIVHPNGDVE